MPKKADLHVHTNFSDGTFSPEEAVRYASEVGLDCIAICDHDVIDGIDPAMKTGEKYAVEVIPAIELTAEKQGSEIHILGYFIDWKDEIFIQRLKHLCRQRENRICDMLEKLKTRGISLDPQEVFKVKGSGSVGRLHLARALQKNGFTRTVDEAFRRYIGDGKPCYVSKINLTPEEGIAEIIRVGGVPVLAHPGVMGKKDFILSYIKHGLAGIEVYHTEHAPAAAREYEEIAKKYNLLITGGSDCHGRGKSRILMGSITVPYEVVEKLRNAARR